jgi:hypothetical protein
VNTEGLIAEGAGLLLWILLAYGLIGATMAGLGKEKRGGGDAQFFLASGPVTVSHAADRP